MGTEHDKQPATQKTFWRRLATDPTANTIVISAAALVPLMAMVGGGVDASRYYMAESRLQAACDAGALAARRAMDQDTFASEHETIANNFFDQNYRDGQFGMEDLTRTYIGTADGKVQGTATGRLPTTIMDAFGYDEFNLTVECEADINISNTDIMFVLDVTGSMNCAPDNPGGGSCGNTPDPGSKIDALRSATLTFYDTVEAATSDTAQVRYGIVPYSNAVNVGNSLDRAWLADTHTYQSREPTVIVNEEWITIGSSDENRTGERYNYDYIGRVRKEWQPVSSSDCSNYYYNYQEWDVFESPNGASGTVISDDGTTRVTEYTGRLQWRVLYDGRTYNYNNSRDRCRIDFDTYTYTAYGTATVTEQLQRTETPAYRYDAIEYDLTSLYSSGSFTAPTGSNGSGETHTWAGCIEEANTSPNTTTDFSPIPAAANDLDIDLVPNGADEYWKPAINSLVFYRYDSSGNWSRDEQITTSNWNGNPTDYCPKAARKLAPFASRSDLESWLSEANGFRARGSTYHDIGMIWGGRFISPDGIFSSENSSAPNGDAITRHIIFMTDGLLSTSNTVYTPYGIEWWDRRITDDGNNGTSRPRHADRFQAACKAARDKNISVWVVAFGTSLSQNLIDCATPGRAYEASDSDSLDAAFTEIAEKIAALRLTA
ncbi:pilus assembly protein TadG-related protein [Erythrobacter sp. GH1-10]|uniref:pilus assembly protein TadG-related protein n=1 Tax=Erythrobacter sp. GH1-10 TaxID=3349334 RepID=UPI003877EBF0